MGLKQIVPEVVILLIGLIDEEDIAWTGEDLVLLIDELVIVQDQVPDICGELQVSVLLFLICLNQNKAGLSDFILKPSVVAILVLFQLHAEVPQGHVLKLFYDANQGLVLAGLIVIKSELVVLVPDPFVAFFGQVVEVHFDFIDFVGLELGAIRELVRRVGPGVDELEPVVPVVPLIDFVGHIVVPNENGVVVILRGPVQLLR